MDRELAVKRAGGRSELATELHGMLLKSIPELRLSIQGSWEAQDMDALYTHVHKLNGSTRYCGVPELEEKCETLETQLRNTTGDLGTAYQELMEAIQRVLDNPAEF